MRSYQDKAYGETRALMLAQARLPRHFVALAAWIGSELGVRPPVNIRFEPVEPLRIRARLEVIFKYASDAAALIEKARLAEESSPQLDPRPKIIDRFRAIATGTPEEELSQLETEIRFYSFEEPARWKVNSSMPDDQIKRIEASLARFGVWKIFQSFDAVTFLFHKDEQLAQSLHNGARSSCEHLYARALRPYDGFRFFDRTPVKAHFDSKETFERDFGGSWIEYAKDS